MSGTGVAVAVLSVLSGLAINEMSDVSPWLARVLIRKAAYLQHGHTPRGEVRAEELEAMVSTDRPGKLLKLCTALGFLAAAVPAWVRRGLAIESGAGSGMGLEPSDFVAMRLFPTERYRGEWTPHWSRLAKNIAFAAFVAVVAVLAAARQLHGTLETLTIAAVFLAFALRVVHVLLERRFARFVITNKRIMVTSGVITRQVAMMPLLRVTDMKYEQSPLGRLLDYGSFKIESAGRRHALQSVQDLPNPAELYLRVVEEMYEPQAVEARLGKDDEDSGSGIPRATALQQQVIDRIGELSDRQLRAIAVLLDLHGDDEAA